ncbi:MAG TPA: hypothetical protein VFQ86_12550, partial [Arachidicoccus soli]|nr:hypothetical protein [Arachidicoccus soli]
MRKLVLTILGIIFAVSVIWSVWYMGHKANSGKDITKNAQVDPAPKEVIRSKIKSKPLRVPVHPAEKKLHSDSTISKKAKEPEVSVS